MGTGGERECESGARDRVGVHRCPGGPELRRGLRGAFARAREDIPAFLPFSICVLFPVSVTLAVQYKCSFADRTLQVERGFLRRARSMPPKPGNVSGRAAASQFPCCCVGGGGTLMREGDP